MTTQSPGLRRLVQHRKSQRPKTSENEDSSLQNQGKNTFNFHLNICNIQDENGKILGKKQISTLNIIPVF